MLQRLFGLFFTIFLSITLAACNQNTNQQTTNKTDRTAGPIKVLTPKTTKSSIHMAHPTNGIDPTLHITH